MAGKKPRSEDGRAERTIQFFKINIGSDEETGIPRPFDHRPALEMIQALSYEIAGEGGYLRESSGDDICVFADTSNDNALRLGRVRRSAFPMLESAGNVSPLELAEQYGLLESIHVVFFPGNIVGADYNHFGPRITQLGNYLAERCGVSRDRFSISPLLARQSVEQLERLESISVLDLKVRSDFVSAVTDADATLGSSLSSMHDLINDEGATLHLAISPDKENRYAFRDRIIQPLLRLARRDDLRQGATKFEVKGTDEERHSLTVNVLKDHLVVTKQIVRLNRRSRALSDQSAYSAIAEAYNEKKSDLVRAAEVIVNG